MSEPRIIKKYPNRRLYDTAISSYITLEDVKQLVIQQILIKVIDARSQEDITHNTLLQIILEQEEKGPSLFSTDSLQEMIRFYGGSMQKLLGTLIEQGIMFFSQQQSFLQDKWMPEWQQHPEATQWMNDLSQKNVLHWQQFQQQWLSSLASWQKKPSVYQDVPQDSDLKENTG